MDDGCGSINVDTSFISEILLRNAQCRQLSAHYIQQGLARQVGFVGYIEFVVLNFVTAPSRCQKKAQNPAPPNCGAQLKRREEAGERRRRWASR
ncbi:hypothetical protein ALQ57_102159 [Pseudomonas amygdali pv. hibisci]|uniref:Uncharacterized protein n=1 Tax=Pseudomonas amygdali pv. hibisci TaxID=251723 RepID=A0AB34U5L4_PSEA0|nr:hypothetical protein ALO67_102104 [Pseudomonas amygdali pv. hibisci]RMN52090.1 hypothetical protein ALQ57_102159 [Pseudomonas amygdali pv. hibisci]